MELRFLPEVEEDVMAGYVWYEDKALGLGEEFLRMFYAQARGIPNNPLMFPKVYGDFRRRLLRRFPYAVYFFLEEEHTSWPDSSIARGIRKRSARLYEIEMRQRAESYMSFMTSSCSNTIFWPATPHPSP